MLDLYEYWKAVDWAPMYSISTFGNVGNVKTGKILKPTKHKSGYYIVTLNRKNIYVHRLVAEAFLPNAQNKRTVNHIDGDKLNNRLINLEWATYAENVQHAYDVLGVIGTRGTKHPKSKLTPEQVLAIKKLKGTATGETVAKQFKVSRSLIYGIWSGTHWGYLDTLGDSSRFRNR